MLSGREVNSSSLVFLPFTLAFPSPTVVLEFRPGRKKRYYSFRLRGHCLQQLALPCFENGAPYSSLPNPLVTVQRCGVLAAKKFNQLNFQGAIDERLLCR